MSIYLKGILIVAAIFGVIFGYAHEVEWYSNTFGIKALIFRSLAVGGILGGIVGWFLRKKATDLEDRMPIFIGCIIVGLAVFPIKAIWLNHFFADQTPLSKKVIFERETPIRGSRFGIIKGFKMPAADGFYTYFLMDLEEQRVRSRQPIFPNVASGQTVELPLRQGLFGFQIVDLQ